jgi:phage terminase large subunit-like protein
VRLRRAAPYPWQYEVAQVAGELNDAGDGFRYPVIVLSVPRRAGKSTLVLAANLDRMDLIDDSRNWYTAQTRENAAKLYRDEWVPMLDQLTRLYRLRKSQGSEGIHKRRGSSRLQIFAPVPEALHSTNVDTATVDEAWSFDVDVGAAIMGGITPAQLTRPWRQTWIVSAGGTIESTWWDYWLTAGESELPGVAMFDYGADADAADYDPADPDVWRQAHPTAGRAFPLDVLAAEWARRRDDAEFERAYLNVWPRPSTVIAAGGVDVEAWRAAARPHVRPDRVVALALDVARDRSAATIAAAGWHDGALVVDVVDARPGIGWLASAVKAARAAHRGVEIVADSLVAASIVAELKRARVDVTPIGATDHARACGTFDDRLAAGTLLHRAQPVLDDAVTRAARRPLGDGWLWSRRKSGGDISPLVAVTLAAFAASQAPAGGRGAVVTAASATASPSPGRSRRPGYPHSRRPVSAAPGAV